MSLSIRTLARPFAALALSLGLALPAVPAHAASDWSQISTGSSHTCGIRVGELYCWGSDGSGRLGNGGGVGEDSDVPQRIGAEDDWTKVSAGGSHTCGIRASELHCWGSDVDGRLGNGDATTTNVTAPQRVEDKTGWTSVVASDVSTCAIRIGKLYCWGADLEGALGNGSESDDDVSSPERVGDKTGWSKVTAGPLHTCGIRIGRLFCWGSDGDGQLGNGELVSLPVHVPLRIGVKADWSLVDAGEFTTCGIRASKLFCWGKDSSGQVGNGDAIGDVVAPKRISDKTDWSKVAVGTNHACGIRTGKLFCWGSDVNGQIGDGANGDSDVEAPARIDSAASDWKAADAGEAHTCGLRTGALFCWGSDGSGRLGNDDANTADVHAPEQITSPE